MYKIKPNTRPSMCKHSRTNLKRLNIKNHFKLDSIQNKSLKVINRVHFNVTNDCNILTVNIE